MYKKNKEKGHVMNGSVTGCVTQMADWVCYRVADWVCYPNGGVEVVVPDVVAEVHLGVGLGHAHDRLDVPHLTDKEEQDKQSKKSEKKRERKRKCVRA